MDEKLREANAPEDNEENKNAISADLIRGHINTIILRALYERDKYGYEIIEEIEAKSHGQYSLKQPTLYSALKRLESQGYINAYWKNDEVSQGGRRKYFTLTDSGRQFAERNQAEWEYSRTVIDSLISDKSFDFNQPAPAAVDFKILKNATSRVPVIKEESDEKAKIDNAPAEREVKYEDPVTEQKITLVREGAEIREQTIQEAKPEPVAEPVPDKKEEPAPPEMSEEERKLRHENYLKLITEPIAKPKEETPQTPYSDNIDTEKLIYNNRPEPERDYRNLINNLFARSIKPKQEAPAPEQRQEIPVTPSYYEDPLAKADADGLTLNPSEYEALGSRRKKFNRGKTLLTCSLIVGVIMLLEFAFSLGFKETLQIGIGYPFVILALAAAQIAIFGILSTTDFGKSTRRPTSHSYLSASLIVAVILIFIICAVAFLLDINFASAGDVAAKIIIPALVALNIPLFSICFWLFSK